MRETGGLKDTVVPYNEYTGEGTGFSFANYNADEMLRIIYYAMDVYYNRKNEWSKIIDNGMAVDYSWNVSADKYIDMYRQLTGIYDIPVQKPKQKAEEKSFDEKLKEDADKSAEEIIKKADEPKITEVENPFAEEKKKPAAKSAAKKTTRKPAAKTAAKKTEAKKTAPKTAAKKPAAKTAAKKAAPKAEKKTSDK